MKSFNVPPRLAFGLLLVLVPTACHDKSSSEKPSVPPTKVIEPQNPGQPVTPAPEIKPQKPGPILPSVNTKPTEPKDARESEGDAAPTPAAADPADTAAAPERTWDLKKPALSVNNIAAFVLPAAPVDWSGKLEGLAQLRQDLVTYYVQQWKSGQADLDALKASLEDSYENYTAIAGAPDLERHEIASAKLWNERLKIVQDEFRKTTGVFERSVNRAQNAFLSKCTSSLSHIKTDLIKKMNKRQPLPTSASDPNFHLTETMARITLSFQCERNLLTEFYPDYSVEKAELESILKLEEGPLVPVRGAYQDAVQRLKNDETTLLNLARTTTQSVRLENVVLERTQLDAAAQNTIARLVDKTLMQWYSRHQCADNARAEACKTQLATLRERVNKLTSSPERQRYFKNRNLDPNWIASRVNDEFEAIYARKGPLLTTASMMDWALFRFWDHDLSREEPYNNRLMSSMALISYPLSDRELNTETLTSSTELLDSTFSSETLVSYIDDAGMPMALSDRTRTTFPMLIEFYGARLKDAADDATRAAVIKEFQSEVDKALAAWDEQRRFLFGLIQSDPHLKRLKTIWAKLGPAAEREIKQFVASEDLRRREQDLLDSIQLTGLALVAPLVTEGQLNPRHIFVTNWLYDIEVDLELVAGLLLN